MTATSCGGSVGAGSSPPPSVPGAPIIPVAIVGAEETYPKIGEIPALARLLGLPYFPVTPTFPWLGPLGLVPLPSKWLIEVGEPIDPGPWRAQADDPLAIVELADQIRDTIGQALRRLLERRPDPFEHLRRPG